MKKQSYTIISVGGSIIPKEGFDIVFLQKFRELILKHVKDGMRFVLIAGGGTTARTYQEAARSIRHMTHTELDWLGIAGTILNARFLQTVFGDAAASDIVVNPTKKVSTRKSIIIASGWKPGCSTDMDAVLLAKQFKAADMINLSNIEQVYDADPRVDKNAKAIESIDWKTFRKDIVGDTWEPGKNVPFDPIASKLAQKLKLTVSMVKGTDLAQVENALLGRPFFGTVIHP
jgi:uridylate kinase